MFWIRAGLHGMSISDWLTAGPVVVPDSSDALEDARDAMLDVLGDGRRKRASLALRIEGARDAASLWALRPALMTAACQLLGEAEARRRMAAATAFFEALLPAASAPRKRRAPAAGVAR